jgi:predicted dehydrogenase
MLRIGIISAATYGAQYRDEHVRRQPGSFHGTAFSSTFNGYDPDGAQRYDWTFAPSEKRIEDARVVKIWDPHRQWAERLAEVCSIDEVCETPESCTQDVDAVIIVDDGSGSQYRYAFYPLDEGIPTFCDKPMAMTAHEAKEIADFAKETGTPFMSASSLRFVPDIVALAEDLDDLGDVNLATTVCGNHLVYYGLHALSMAYAVLGDGAVSCVNVGREGRNIVRIRFSGGHDVVLIVGEQDHMQSGWQINLYGTDGWRTVHPDVSNLYYYLLERFMRLVRNEEVSVPPDEEVELIAALEAGQRSLNEGREVAIEEVLR